MTAAPRRRPSSVAIGLVALTAVTVALVAYGLWSRRVALADLQTAADDTSLVRAQLTTPQPDTAKATLRLPGEIAAWNDASIYGQVSGYITSWDKDIGAHVHAGEVLATISAPGLDAQYAAAKASLDVAQAAYNIAQVTAKRFQALSGSNGVSQQDIDDRVATAAQQKAQLAAAEQTVNQFAAQIGFEKVVAPFDGIVTARTVNVGDFVSGSGGDAQRATMRPLFRVVDTHKLRVFVSVPQSYSALLRSGLKAVLTLNGDPARSFSAEFLATSGSVSRTTRTINTEFVIDPPPAQLQPGAYVTVTLAGMDADPSALTVPSQAILFRAEGPQVAFVDAGDVVRLHSVTLGHNLGLTTQVVKGLSSTDRLIANPSLGLLDGQKVKVVTSTPGYQPGSGAAGH